MNGTAIRGSPRLRTSTMEPSTKNSNFAGAASIAPPRVDDQTTATGTWFT